MAIEISGAWLESDSGGKELGKRTLFFSDWKELDIRQYYPDANQWIKLSCSSFEVISDICEFDYLNQQIYLRGFGKKSGLWTEYKMNPSFIKFEFEEIKEFGEQSA